MPRPENARISGNCACSFAWNVDASNTSNRCIPPSALGKEMIVPSCVALAATDINSCRSGPRFRLNNLNSLGNDVLVTALSFEKLSALLLFADQIFSWAMAFSDIQRTKAAIKKNLLDFIGFIMFFGLTVKPSLHFAVS